MAFDQTTRNRLASFVAKTRKLLADEFVRQLQNEYGLDPVSGDMADAAMLEQMDDARRATGRLLRDTAAHYLAGADASTPAKAKKARQDVLSRIVREQAFTVLNRLCALRMAESRGLLIESLGKGYQSDGFKLYQMIANGAQGPIGDTYRHFLFGVFDEFAVDLSVLFDRFSPQGRLFPRESVLLEVLDEINHPDIAPLWAEDETIGWIYQYFNSIEERRAMRDASSAPRNSRELAVRNQFFTPRYVVEFLTDNTLGRIWYEMTRGETALAERCRYLVRRPDESLPERPLKDPREIRMLDPACGSMHFGLYSFDLYEVIYAEAWDLEEKLGADSFVRTEHALSLHETYATCEEFLQDVPKLIIENNIHGVDIDPRAVQIAGLSLWLRAQRAWKDMGLAAGKRPQIEKANVVCAEPMPGEGDLLDEFADNLRPRVLGQLLKKIFKKMQLAGDAGSLLRIEEDIRAEIKEAHDAFVNESKKKPKEAFLDGLAPIEKPKAEQELFDFSDLKAEGDFWQTAEQRLVGALREYAESAADDAGLKRLFAADAARGFALIDLLKKRFDVLVMNPPFGEAAEKTVGYLTDNYPNWTKNILCCFIIRALELLVEDGMTGAIFDRTASIKVSYEDFRQAYMIPHLRYIADTGWNVLDANVETTVHVYQKTAQSHVGLGFDVRDVDPNLKANELVSCITTDDRKRYCFDPLAFRSLPNAVIGYDFHRFLLHIFSDFSSLESVGLASHEGHNFVSDCHFRLFYEISPLSIVSENEKFEPLYNGGRFSLFCSPIRDITLYGKNAKLVESHPSTTLRNLPWHHGAGVGYGKRGEIIDAHLLYRHMSFTAEGKGMSCLSFEESFTALSYLNSALAQFVINQYCGQHKHVGYVNLLPFPSHEKTDGTAIDVSKKGYKLKYTWMQREETTLSFNSPWERVFAEHQIATLQAAVDWLKHEYESDSTRLDELIEENDTLWFDRAGLSDEDRAVVRKGVQARPHDTPWLDAADEIQTAGFEAMFVRRLVSYAVGRVFGRFRGDLPASSEDLFEPPLALREWNLGTTNFEVSPAVVPMERTGVNELAQAVLGELQNMFPEDDLADKLAHSLGVRDFGEYFLSPNGFFDDHFKLYSKSRRIAPLYLPISVPSGNFTLWVYYQRITSQTLYTCINDFIEPRIKIARERIDQERAKSSRTSQENETLDYEQTMLDELSDMREAFLALSKTWRPDLDDGIQMTIAPLWRFFRHRLFQTKLKEAWTAIENGEYEWTRHALMNWPERVVAAAHADHSTAIAHDLERELWEEVEVTRRGRTTKEWRPRELTASDLKAIVEMVKERK